MFFYKGFDYRNFYKDIRIWVFMDSIMDFQTHRADYPWAVKADYLIAKDAAVITNKANEAEKRLNKNLFFVIGRPIKTVIADSYSCRLIEDKKLKRVVGLRYEGYSDSTTFHQTRRILSVRVSGSKEGCYIDCYSQIVAEPDNINSLSTFKKRLDEQLIEEVEGIFNTALFRDTFSGDLQVSKFPTYFWQKLS